MIDSVRESMDREFDVEMASHLHMAIEENMQRGLPPEEAHRREYLAVRGQISDILTALCKLTAQCRFMVSRYGRQPLFRIVEPATMDRAAIQLCGSAVAFSHIDIRLSLRLLYSRSSRHGDVNARGLLSEA